ncbi:MAG: outer membrane protein assembly factor [Planctomycetota bacterium]|nr:outer membrane protein assembly factor [Planctomycetota bacterium]
MGFMTGLRDQWSVAGSILAACIAVHPNHAATASFAPLTLATTPMDIGDKSLQDRPISDIEFRGLKRTVEQDVRNNIRVAPGQPFDAKTIRNDIATLYRLGHFEAVEADATVLADGSVRVTYVFTEQPIVADIQVVGNTVISDQDIVKDIGLFAGGPRDDFLVEAGVRKVKGLYRVQGYYSAEVRVDDTMLTETGILIIRVIEGPRVRVRDIDFTGNATFGDTLLIDQIETSSWIFILRKGELDEEQLIDDVASLVKFYKERGYIDVRVDRRVEISPEGDEAKVIFVIDEGSQYTLRSVRIASPGASPDAIAGAPTARSLAIFSPEQALGLLEMRPGDIFTSVRVTESEDALERAYGEMGYIDAQVHGDWIRIGPEPEVDFLLRVNPGRSWTAGIVRIQGNDLTKDNVIRRDIPIESGRILNGGALKDAEQKLRELRLFSDVRITPQAPSEGTPHIRDVLVEVKEMNTGSVNFGAGVGTDTGIFGTFSVVQRNFDLADFPLTVNELLTARAFRGAGQTFNLTIAPGNEISQYSISIFDPRLLDSEWGGGVTGYYRIRDYQNSANYTEQRIGENLTITRRLGDVWRGTANYRFENVELYNFDSDTPIEVVEYAGPANVDSLGLVIQRTTVDSRMRPSRGSQLELETNYHGLIADYPYLEVGARLVTFLAVDEDFLGRRSVLRATVEARHAFEATNGVPIYERYYLGGRSLRGFQFRTVSPKSEGTIGAPNTPNDEPVGGTFLFFAGLQQEFPLFDRYVSWVTFIDSGTVVDNVSFEQYRASIGIGIRIAIPAFGPVPLAFDLAVPIAKQDTDETQVFSFTMDLPF